MKRALLAVGILTLLIIVGAASLAAQDDSSSLVIRPSTMKDGESKTLIDDGRKITVKRNGDSVNIEIDGAGETRRLTIVKGDGEIVIDSDRQGRRLEVLGPGSSRILLDGLRGPHGKKQGLTENWFVCPEDQTMLRVSEGKEGAVYKCPVDGTVMEKKKGRGFSIWMSEGSIEGTQL